MIKGVSIVSAVVDRCKVKNVVLKIFKTTPFLLPKSFRQQIIKTISKGSNLQPMHLPP
jgi:hypothetical protein